MASPRRYSANHKPWDHVGNLTPGWKHSEGRYPHFDAAVAAWLPINGSANSIAMGFISRYDKELHTEDYKVVSAGKVVAVDGAGALLPAGVRKAWDAASGGDTVLTYTAADVEWGVYDLGTGGIVTAAKTYTKTELQTQLRQMGLLTPTQTLVEFISKPVGLAAYDYFRSAGSDLNNPQTYSYHNYKRQHFTGVLCDYVVRLPWVPSAQATCTAPAFSDAFAIANIDDENSTGVWGSLSTFQTELDRYDDETNTDVVGLATRFAPAATHTSRTPLLVYRSSTDITSSVLIRQRSSIDGLTQAGDWFWDAEVGVLWFYEAGGNALPTGMNASDTVRFHHYRTVPTSVSTFASVVGNLEPGDFVTYDKFSNLVKRTDFTSAEVTVSSSGNPSDAELATIMQQVVAREDETLGQVLGFWDHPRDALNRVRTAYTGLGTMDAMPGSATGGQPDSITYASAADMEVIINLITR